MLARWRTWTPWHDIPWYTWVTLSMLCAVAVLSFAFRDPGLFVVLLGALMFATGVYTLVRRRFSWARLGSRQVRLVFLSVGAIVFVAGLILLTLTPQNLPTKPSESRPAPLPTVPSAIPSSPPIRTPAPPQSVSFGFPDIPTAADAEGLLATLPVKGRAPKTGYDRQLQFGAAWVDVDQNGCDTRNDILNRDLSSVVLRDKCTVQTGSFVEPYTGKEVFFVRGEQSILVQIDHVVALSNAWQTGAQQLSLEQRVLFANDPLNLLAVDGEKNMQKGDGDAATWLPPNKGFRCEYVARQVTVKATYNLWVTLPERNAIERVLSGCPAQPVTTR